MPLEFENIEKINKQKKNRIYKPHNSKVVLEKSILEILIFIGILMKYFSVTILEQLKI
jgi:hypothetical protein